MTDATTIPDAHALLAQLEEGQFDFVDFGCSRGGSIRFAMSAFGAKRGLGIDLSASKVSEARSAGFEAIVYDIDALPNKPMVRFCTMLHFLEHIPDHRSVRAFMKKAAAVSREFIAIRQPYFDADGYLFMQGLKLYWSDWRGHCNAMSTLEFHCLLSEMRRAGLIEHFSIHLRKPIESSAHSAIHPIDSPQDQHNYDAAVHSLKPMDIRFDFPVYSEVVVLITKPGVDHYKPFAKFPRDRTIFDSARSAPSSPDALFA